MPPTKVSEDLGGLFSTACFQALRTRRKRAPQLLSETSFLSSFVTFAAFCSKNYFEQKAAKVTKKEKKSYVETSDAKPHTFWTAGPCPRFPLRRSRSLSVFFSPHQAPSRGKKRLRRKGKVAPPRRKAGTRPRTPNWRLRRFSKRDTTFKKPEIKVSSAAGHPDGRHLLVGFLSHLHWDSHLPCPRLLCLRLLSLQSRSRLSSDTFRRGWAA